MAGAELRGAMGQEAEGAELRGARALEAGGGWAKSWRASSEAGFVLEQAAGTRGAVDGAREMRGSWMFVSKPESTWLLSSVCNEVRHQSQSPTCSAPAEAHAPPTCSLLSHSNSYCFCWGPQTESYLLIFSHRYPPHPQHPKVEYDGHLVAG